MCLIWNMCDHYEKTPTNKSEKDKYFFFVYLFVCLFSSWFHVSYPVKDYLCCVCGKQTAV